MANGHVHMGSNLLQHGCTIRMFFVESITLSPTLKGITGFLFGSVMAIILDLADCSIICVCVTACFIASVDWNVAGMSDLISRKQCCMASSALILVALALMALSCNPLMCALVSFVMSGCLGLMS
jgi:hypothetical protein